MKYYNFKNILSTTVHSALTATGACAVYLMAGPWSIAAGVALASLKFGTMLVGSRNNDILDGLAKHPEKHRYSPRLGEIIRRVADKANINPDDLDVVSLNVDEKKVGSDRAEALREAFQKMAGVPNAAAIDLGRKKVIVSDELFQLMSDREEEAVIAHEIAHIISKHVKASILPKALGYAGKMTNMVGLYSEALVGGVLKFTGVILGGVGLSFALSKVSPNGDLISKKQQDLSPADLYKRKQMLDRSGFFTKYAVLAAFTHINPAYFPFWLGVKAINTALHLTEQSQSRSNEYMADRVAVEQLGANPLALITALKKLDALQQRSLREAFEGADIPKVTGLRKIWKELNSTHPSVQKRVEHLADIARTSGFDERNIERVMNTTPDVSHAPNIPLHVIRRALAA